MSELIDCIDGLRAEDIFRRIAKTANGEPFYLNTVGAGSSFLPTDLPNLEIWYAPDNLSAGALAQWTDLSGNNNHATQGGAPDQPTVVANQVNGYADVEFDGVSDHFDITTPLASSSITIYAIAYTVAGLIYLQGRNAVTDKFIYIQSTTPRWRTTDAQDFTFPADANKWHIWEFQKDGNNKYMWRNGTASVSNPQISATNDRIEVMAKSGATLSALKICEYIYYSAVLTAPQRTQVRDYLNNKYAIY